MTLTQTTDAEELATERKLWLIKHRGVLSAVRKKIKLHQTTVRRVFYGEITSAGSRVEREFARLGAPGFDAFKRRA